MSAVSCLAGPQANQATDDEEASHRADLRLLAHTIVGFAAQQNLRLDTFAMGSASRALGEAKPFLSCHALVRRGLPSCAPFDPAPFKLQVAWLKHANKSFK